MEKTELELLSCADYFCIASLLLFTAFFTCSILHRFSFSDVHVLHFHFSVSVYISN